MPVTLLDQLSLLPELQPRNSQMAFPQLRSPRSRASFLHPLPRRKTDSSFLAMRTILLKLRASQVEDDESSRRGYSLFLCSVAAIAISCLLSVHSSAEPSLPFVLALSPILVDIHTHAQKRSLLVSTFPVYSIEVPHHSVTMPSLSPTFGTLSPYTDMQAMQRKCPDLLLLLRTMALKDSSEFFVELILPCNVFQEMLTMCTMLVVYPLKVDRKYVKVLQVRVLGL